MSTPASPIFGPGNDEPGNDGSGDPEHPAILHSAILPADISIEDISAQSAGSNAGSPPAWPIPQDAGTRQQSAVPPGGPRITSAIGSRLPAPMQSVRFRLTLLYSLILFGVSCFVVGGIYWGLSRDLENRIVAAEMAAAEPGPRFDIEQDRFELQQELEIQIDARTLETLRRFSLVGLGSIFFISFGVGWFTAGRVLMPIGRITRVAKDIQATDLSRRIGLLGPNDDLKQLSDTFDAMLDRLQRAFDNQQRLIHDTSHELRNPLAIMRTNLDVTLSDPDADLEQYQHTIEVVRRSSERMSKLVDDLLAYARHEATTRVEAPFDLSHLVTDLVDEFRGAAEHERLRLAVDVEPDLRVMGHALSVEQAVANLLANAVRFAPIGSAISVGAGKESGWVWLTVSDQGPGIATDERDRVFQRYVRLGEGEVGRPHLAGGEGSGLGLAIVREIVQAHRGEVSIIDTDVGATFAVWMPEHQELEVSGEFRRKRPKRRQIGASASSRSEKVRNEA